MLRLINSKGYSSRMKLKQNGVLYFTVAAICRYGAEAFISPSSSTTSSPSPCFRKVNESSRIPTHWKHHDSRLYFSSQKDNNDEGGLFSKVGSAVKSVLPKKWFGTDEEKEKIQKRKEVKQQISGGLDQVLKDAPLGLRMMGKMISPIMTAAASTMAESMREQQATTEKVLQDAREYITADNQVTSILGFPIQIGMPFSQASSSTIINGVKQTRVELGVPISGNQGSGVARILATEDGIAQLQVEAGGRVINVDCLSKPQGQSSSQSRPYISKSEDDDIIEAEIVDKDTKY